MTDQSRREFLLRSLCGCGLGLPGANALARILPSHMSALVSPDYAPKDLDERGLWQICGQLEEQLAASNLRIKDAALNDYLQAVMRRLLGDMATDARIYPMRNADFNASMFPNGMMVVNSGLLARMRNEGQLAAVLGHECGHYLRRHSLQGWRNMRSTTAVMAFVAVGSAAASGATGTNWYNVANAINNGLLLSMFTYKREQESEADAYGLKLLSDASYPPSSAAEVWAQLIEERKASASARKKRYQDNSSSVLSTHPPSAERMQDLAQSGKDIEQRKGLNARYDDGRTQWLSATASLRPSLVEEQIKLNDPGASLYLLNSLAKDGWDCVLRFYEGETYRLRDEPGDAALASQAYAAAVKFPDALPEAYRAHGYAQIKAGNADEGRRALSRYLELQPAASDAEMVRFTLGQ